MVQQMAIYDQVIVSALILCKKNSSIICFDRTQVGMFSVSYVR